MPLSTSGFGFQLFYPGHPAFNQVAHIWFMAVTSLSIFLFLNMFFNVDLNERLHKLRKLFVILWIIPLTLTFIQKYELMRMMSHFLVLANFTLFYLLIQKYWKEKRREAQIFAIAFGCLIIGGVSQILYIHGIAPQNFFFYHSYIIGGLLQMLIFSFGLALKIKDVQEESLKNKTKLIEINQNLNTFLKNQVTEKTEALEKKNQRLSFFDDMSHIRRIVDPVEDLSTCAVSRRRLHGTQYGCVCPLETPEGAAEALNTVNIAVDTVSSAVSELGSSVLRVEQQAEFTTSLDNVLKEGLGNLVDADLGTETAKSAAEKVKVELGLKSLAIANAGPNAMKSLFPG